MYQAFANAVNWLLVSSSDATAVSATIRGVLIALVPTAMVLMNLSHINVGPDQANELVDGFVNFVQAVLTLIATGHILFGIVRKTWNTAFPQYAF